MDSKALTAPAGAVILTPPLNVTWIDAQASSPSSDIEIIGEAFGNQPDIVIVHKLIHLSEDCSDHDMNRIADNSTYDNVKPAYS